MSKTLLLEKPVMEEARKNLIHFKGLAVNIRDISFTLKFGSDDWDKFLINNPRTRFCAVHNSRLSMSEDVVLIWYRQAGRDETFKFGFVKDGEKIPSSMLDVETFSDQGTASLKIWRDRILNCIRR